MKAQGYLKGVVSVVLILTVQLQVQASTLGNFLIQKPDMAQSPHMMLPFAGQIPLPAGLHGAAMPIQAPTGNFSSGVPALSARLEAPQQTPAPTADARPQEKPSTVKQWQSSTLLPDGQILLLGGFDANHKPVVDAYLVDRTEKTQKITAQLQVPRAGHTATVLPDGTVLVFGGVNASGDIVSTAEIFDPIARTFSTISTRLIPRAFHSATLLTDGTLLIAGGVEQNHVFPADIQKWDYRKGQVTSFDALLTIPRQGHSATLLSDGTVRLFGGTDLFGMPAQVDEIFDPAVNRFHLVTPNEASPENLGQPRVAASIPQDGASGVDVQDILAMRLTTPLDVTSVTSASFTLMGSDNVPVAAKVTAAEQGRLVFLLPAAPLQTGTTYTLQIQKAADTQGNAIIESSITFTTEGEASSGQNQGSDGSGPTTTQFRNMPPLQSTAGDTALAGQVLKLNGLPLEQVTLQMGDKRVQTDSTGRFLLRGLSATHQVLVIDAQTASRSNAVYGRYEVGVTVLASKTNVLNYTIWMTQLDMAHAVNIPSPTSTETVITNPTLPGLKLHLPPNTVITDAAGKTVHQISITPIPLNQPPFPLPAGVRVPIYFTIQPGGAYIKVLNAGNGSAGARLVYPNTFNFKSGTPFNFWNYDADVKGWFIYGSGTVSPNGISVIPDPGVVLYEFTGAMVGSPNAAPNAGPPAGPGSQDGDPVDLSTGQFIYSKTDMSLPDVVPINLTRTYIANDSLSRAFGIGTTQSYDIFMVGDTFPYTYQELILPNGSRIRFDRISAGTSWTDAVYISTSPDPLFYGATLHFNSNDTWSVTRKDGTQYVFPDSFAQSKSQCQAVIQIIDRHGSKTKLDRTNCNLTQITSPNGRFIQLQYDSSGRVTTATDNIGRTTHYTYDPVGRLSTVTDLNGGVTTYTYTDQNELATITDARGITYLTNEYDANGRVVKQTQGDGSTYLFSWILSSNPNQTHYYQNGTVTSGTLFEQTNCWNGTSYNRYDPTCQEGYLPLVTQVDITDPRGYVRRVQFGPSGYKTSDTHALGQPEQQTITYSYYADNSLKSVTDALGRTTSYDYDALGNRIRTTYLDGTANASTTSFTYEPLFQGMATVTDSLGHTSTFGYGGSGNLTSITDPLNHQTTLTYNANGQIATITDALNNTVQSGYFSGDLVSITDPLGNTATRFVDLAGRLASTTDALGNTTKFQYNGYNLVTRVTDAQGNSTAYTYDANGNLLTLSDAAGYTTSYTYDSMDRKTSKTDALNRHESFTYDLNGNLSSHTDRKGQVTAFTYDGLNCRTLAGFGVTVTGGMSSYQSTVSYTHDGGNRITQISDSLAGNITRGYDGLDRLVSEATPQGSIGYTYDLVGRRTSMTVNGQSAVSYSYDNADRLTQISQGSSSVSFNYDDDNRRSSLVLPNGVTVSYTYDQASHVTDIGYQLGANHLGELTYAYDQLGRRTQVGGSFARTGLPGAVGAASYDAANELTNWNGTPISYDSNGNMVSDGTNAFTWNVRNQVATVNSVSLQYDAVGRRIKNPVGTSLLYDGANAVQELSGSTVTANALTGGVDDLFTRTDSSGAFIPLQDALGSTIALVDSGGNIQTTYSYDPFGNTTTGGAASPSSSQYTGRENDGNGLYFYRARYYSPALQRFISEDPIGVKGGINLYAYADNNPVTLRDPNGKNPLAIAGCLIGAGAGAFAYHEMAGRKASLGGYALSAAAGCGLGALAGFGLAGLLPEVAAPTSVFWSGGTEAQAAATAWAEANGGVTLGMTEAGQATEAATQGLDWAAAQPMWTATSADFASAASGDVVAFINAAAYNPSSVFATVELGALLSNPAVTSITIMIF
ncbi:MAG TPA: RHS repeat-associated core domain-containing protein [Candidatus Angelobacter sp.]